MEKEEEGTMERWRSRSRSCSSSSIVFVTGVRTPESRLPQTPKAETRAGGGDTARGGEDLLLAKWGRLLLLLLLLVLVLLAISILPIVLLLLLHLQWW